MHSKTKTDIYAVDTDRIPFFYVRPIDAINEFSIDNMIHSLKIKHDNRTGSGKFFKVIFSYKRDRRYIALFSDGLNVFLYPPNSERDFWILKTEKPADQNGNGKTGMA